MQNKSCNFVICALCCLLFLLSSCDRNKSDDQQKPDQAAAATASAEDAKANPAEDAKAEDAALSKIIKRINPDKRLSFIQFDDEEIDGQKCRVYASGENNEGQFVREDHYAICPDDKIYIMDYLTGEYILYDDYELRKQS